MSGRILLDANVVVALLNGEQIVLEHLVSANEIFLPSIVLGELYYGAFKSTRVESNLSRIRGFAERNTVLSCTQSTALFYGQIRNQLRLKGRPIPENDIWIAAIALEHDLTVATRDNYFSEMEVLQIEFW